MVSIHFFHKRQRWCKVLCLINCNHKNFFSIFLMEKTYLTLKSFSTYPVQLTMINNTKNKWTWRRNKEIKTTQITTKETTNIDQTKINNPPKQNSKNRNATSAMNRSQQENIDLLKVIRFVEETMKTLTTENNWRYNWNSIWSYREST